MEAEGTETSCECKPGPKCAAYCRAYVEDNLTVSFRGYAAVTPHDWQTYEEMRSLALDKHGLHIGTIPLPLQASDQRKSLNLLMLAAFASGSLRDCQAGCINRPYRDAQHRLWLRHIRCQQGLKLWL